MARSPGRPESYTAGIIEQIRKLDPDQPVYEVRSMEDWVAKSMQSRSLTTALSSFLASPRSPSHVLAFTAWCLTRHSSAFVNLEFG